MRLTEKYRPKKLEDIVLPDAIFNLIKRYMEENNMPNILLHSQSPGTGKSSLSHIIVNSLDNEHIELNASKDRGIDVVREVIEPFVRTYSFNGKNKCVILSECDQLTSASQDALKDLMEGDVVKRVYYILTTNKRRLVSKYMRSRCVELDFSYPPKDKIEEMLLDISEKESLGLLEPDIDSLIKYFYPDIRKMVSTLSKIAAGLSIEDAIGSELNFYEFYKTINSMSGKNIYLAFEKIAIIPFLHYLFKIYLNQGNLKGILFVKNTIKDIMLGIDEKIAFISNWFNK